MPAIYEQHGLRFAYPENWQLQEPDEDADLIDVTLQTPAGGFWSVQLMPAGCSPAECIQEVVNEIEGEYEGVEKEPQEFDFGSESADGFELRFFCLDMLVEARVWAMRLEQGTLICHYQAEQTEYAAIAPVFQAIATSLFQPDFGN